MPDEVYFIPMSRSEAWIAKLFIDNLTYGIDSQVVDGGLVVRVRERSGLLPEGLRLIEAYRPDMIIEATRNQLPIPVLLVLVGIGITLGPAILCSIKPDLDICVELKQTYEQLKDVFFKVLLPLAVFLSSFYVIYKALK